MAAARSERGRRGKRENTSSRRMLRVKRVAASGAELGVQAHLDSRHEEVCPCRPSQGASVLFRLNLRVNREVGMVLI